MAKKKVGELSEKEIHDNICSNTGCIDCDYKLFGDFIGRNKIKVICIKNMVALINKEIDI